MDDALTLTSLPDDPQALKRLIIDLSRERDDWHAKFHDIEIQKRRIEVEKQTIEVEKLRLEIELLRLKKWYYGRKADQLTTHEDVAQLLLSFGEQLENRPVDVEDVPGDVNLQTVETKTIRRVRRGRRNLAAFENLPVIRREYDLPEDQKACPCCGKMRQKIGQESSWQVEYIPGHFRADRACSVSNTPVRQCELNARESQHRTGAKAQPADRQGDGRPGLLAYHRDRRSSLIICRCTGWNRSSERSALEIGRATHERLVPGCGLPDHQAPV